MKVFVWHKGKKIDTIEPPTGKDKEQSIKYVREMIVYMYGDNAPYHELEYTTEED